MYVSKYMRMYVRMYIRMFAIIEFLLLVTVGFSRTSYSVYESSSNVYPSLSLSNPSPFDLTVKIQDTGSSALRT